ncbi:MAG: winged helix-turn-helix transcriptional regulator [Candidatus Saccharibacteria bacterium]
MQEIDENRSKRRSSCPISFALDVFGDKWSLLILRDIIFYHRTRFSDFTPQEKAATNVLSDRLKKLEQQGIIEKRRDLTLRNQYIYTVTEKGEQLIPMLIELTLWGLEHDADSLASEAFIVRMQSDKPKVVREIGRSIRQGTFTNYRIKKMGINP